MAEGKKSCANLKVADLIVGSMPEQDFESLSLRWSVKPLDLQEMKRVMTRWQIELEGRSSPRLYLTNHHVPKGERSPSRSFLASGGLSFPGVTTSDCLEGIVRSKQNTKRKRTLPRRRPRVAQAAAESSLDIARPSGGQSR